MLLGLYLLASYGLDLSTVIILSGILLLIILYGLRMSVNTLYKIYIDDNGDIEIETLHFNKVKQIRRNRKDVQIKVIQNATSRHIEDMIRIDINRKTYFTQKQFAPWTRKKIQEVKEMVKQGVLP